MADILEILLDNKTTPLRVPGLHGIPINVLLSRDQFAAATNDRKTPFLTAKELAMLDITNTITDRPSWHRAVFDKQAIDQLKEEDAVASLSSSSSSSSLINDKTWDWCLKELPDKVRQSHQNDGRFVVVLNTSSGVCKSSAAISADLKAQLSNSIVLLFHHQALRQKKSGSAVVNLVDPSLFPLVYGRTKFLIGGQSSGMDEKSWSSCTIQEGAVISELPQLHLWSSKFQSLPCDVEFTGSLAIISSSIKQWDNILVRNKWWKAHPSFRTSCTSYPREPVRIRTYGGYKAMYAQVETYLQEPESKDKVYWHELRTQEISRNWKAQWGLLRTALAKYARMFAFEHSDPGTAFSYEDWKAGKTGKAIIGPAYRDYICAPNSKWMYRPQEEDAEDHQFYTVALQDEFQEQGLQVVVRIHSIKLDPETTPFFPGEEWDTEGNAKERIAANAIYALDSDNISEEPQMSFRQGCKLGGHDDDDPELNLPNALWDVEYIGRLFGFGENIQHTPCWQQLGNVKLPPGRLISFPNAFQHRMGPLQLKDKTKPGKFRFLTLSLVDPTYWLCSTRNVVPQQPGWIKPRGDGTESESESATQVDLEEALKLREELVDNHVKKEEALFELADHICFSGLS
ncbi:hypothetical protein BDV06DRAFT_209641 [Aspergillus oleicola]